MAKSQLETIFLNIKSTRSEIKAGKMNYFHVHKDLIAMEKSNLTLMVR